MEGLFCSSLARRFACTRKRQCRDYETAMSLLLGTAVLILNVFAMAIMLLLSSAHTKKIKCYIPVAVYRHSLAQCRWPLHGVRVKGQ